MEKNYNEVGTDTLRNSNDHDIDMGTHTYVNIIQDNNWFKQAQDKMICTNHWCQVINKHKLLHKFYGKG